jgi:hypothetical protein
MDGLTHHPARPAERPPLATTKEKDMKATIIWQQIPDCVKDSLAARNPVVNEKTGYLHFQVGNGHRSIFKVCVQLDPDDTYTVKLVRMVGVAITILREVRGIFADDLGWVLLDWQGRYIR